VASCLEEPAVSDPPQVSSADLDLMTECTDTPATPISDMEPGMEQLCILLSEDIPCINEESKLPETCSVPDEGMPIAVQATSRTDRSQADLQAAEGIGMGATRSTERLLASVGLIQGTPSIFGADKAVENGGILLSLPALINQGLSQVLDKLKGSGKKGYYYSVTHLFVLICFMGMLRIKNPEQLKTYAPGELGKLLGLDRIPTAKKLRQKLKELARLPQIQQIKEGLSRLWIKREKVLFYYFDGHKRIYYGHKAKLTKKHLAQYRLTMAATQDFWVNDREGKPITVIEGELNETLIGAIRSQIPFLLDATKDFYAAHPERVTEDPRSPRLVFLFDREAYSPVLFRELWVRHHIAVVCYRKYDSEKLPEDLFKEGVHIDKLGRKTKVSYYERQVVMPGEFVMREIRILTASGHQTSILSSHYTADGLQLAFDLFSRWNMENFFAYMIPNYGLDTLLAYGICEVNPKFKIPNPQYMVCDRKLREQRALLRRVKADIIAFNLSYEKNVPEHTDEDKMRNTYYVNHLTSLHQYGEQLQINIELLKKERKQYPSKMAVGDMPEKDRYSRLVPQVKIVHSMLMMIAYRAETALFNLINDFYVSAQQDGRMLLRQLFKVPADIIFDDQKQTITVTVHPMSARRFNEVARKLCEQLTATETIYPGTHYRMIYQTLNY